MTRTLVTLQMVVTVSVCEHAAPTDGEIHAFNRQQEQEFQRCMEAHAGLHQNITTWGCGACSANRTVMFASGQQCSLFGVTPSLPRGTAIYDTRAIMKSVSQSSAQALD